MMTMNMFDVVTGKFIHSTIAVEGTQICTTIHTRQYIHHIQVKFRCTSSFSVFIKLCLP